MRRIKIVFDAIRQIMSSTGPPTRRPQGQSAKFKYSYHDHFKTPRNSNYISTNNYEYENTHGQQLNQNPTTTSEDPLKLQACIVLPIKNDKT